MRCAALCQAPRPPAAKGRWERWLEDLHYLKAKFSAKGYAVDLSRGVTTRGQKDFRKLYPSFHADIDALSAEVPTLSEDEIVLRLMKIIASGRVAHNRVQIPARFGFSMRLPLTFTWYADSLVVSAASSNYEAALGMRLLQMGNKPVEEIVMELSPYVSRENDVWLRESVAGLLPYKAILEQAGVVDSQGLVVLTLQRPDETMLALRVAMVDKAAKMNSVLDTRPVPVPLSRNRPNLNYWHQYLEVTHTFYIQYSNCRNDERLRFSDFAKSVLEEIDTRRPKRIVLDMRNNCGGDSRVIRPLRKGLLNRAGKIGTVYILIGPRTFSSAVDNAVEFRKTLRAVLVGEPAGGEPSSYGELKFLMLPNSRLVIQFTSKRFGSGIATGPLMPDIAAPCTLPSVLAGQDPSMDAVLGTPDFIRHGSGA